MAGVLLGVTLGGNQRPVPPVTWWSSAAARSTSARIVAVSRRGMVRWLQVWLPSSWPASWIRAARSGFAASHRPIARTVTWARAFLSTAIVSRTIDSGPSPWNVRATASAVRGPGVMSGPAAGLAVGVLGVLDELRTVGAGAGEGPPAGVGESDDE